jgi:N-methylhydantoinase A/oxoprolinase/acetone carboxylase beta subunit
VSRTARIGVDVSGTFTDIVLALCDGRDVSKSLIQKIRTEIRALEQLGGKRT